MTRSKDSERQVLDTKDLPEEWQELLRDQIAKDAEALVDRSCRHTDQHYQDHDKRIAD